MRKLSRKWKLWGLFLVLMFFAAGATVHTTATDVQAATKTALKQKKEVLLLSEWPEGKRLAYTEREEIFF